MESWSASLTATCVWLAPEDTGADDLVEKHERQRQPLSKIRFVTGEWAPQQLAQEVLNPIRSVRAHITGEEELLSPARLGNDLVEADFPGG